ncbi:MAG: EAL domain-containing protein, partial [Solimonas sp.]
MVGALKRRVAGRTIAGVVGPAFFMVALLPTAFAVALTAAGMPLLQGVVAGAAAGFLLAWRLSSFITRRLKAPLQAAMASIEKVAAGTLEESVPGAEIREFAELSETFNSMTAKFRESTARLVHKAFHDPLTGLPNRALFMTRIQQALATARHRGEHVAVLFFDIDRFKVLNDTLGHGAGDRLLVVFSRRLSGMVQGNRLFARLAGDEFILLVQGRAAEAEAIAVADAILEALKRPLIVHGREMFVTCSIGIAVSDNADTSTELLRKADIALYRAKARGRARYSLYDPDHDQNSVDKIDLDSALRRAIERRQLLLHYQPEVNLSTGDVVGMEALLRWNHPHRGILSPKDFISLAEETGEILNIGQWVLEEACTQASRLIARVGPGADQLVVSVNLSADEFRQEHLVDDVARSLRQSGLAPRNLRLEITESILMDPMSTPMETLSELRNVGVRLAIDDFGTGYSSLSYLQRLPVDTLKIDQSFVGSLGADERTFPIIRAVVQLGDALKMDVTAEGIETMYQLEQLRAAGCPAGQGHYFSPATDEKTVLRLLQSRSG